MDEFLPLKKYVAKYVQLTEEEERQFSTYLKFTKIKKKDFMVKPGMVCLYKSYIVKGAVRAYLIDHTGVEHTIALSIEDWWISDYSSYLNQEPATLYVEALEDTTLIQIDYAGEQTFMKAIPKLETFVRIITQRSLAFQQKRLLATFSQTSEELYDEFILKYPGIANRFPQYMIASYLGFRTEYLSKIRNKKTKKGSRS